MTEPNFGSESHASLATACHVSATVAASEKKVRILTQLWKVHLCATFSSALLVVHFLSAALCRLFVLLYFIYFLIHSTYFMKCIEMSLFL